MSIFEKSEWCKVIPFDYMIDILYGQFNIREIKWNSKAVKNDT